MMRACHLNTCPVGIATQDPELRKRFKGTPEHVVNFFFFVAEEVREILASLGLRSLDEAIGRVDLLGAADGDRPLEGARRRPHHICSRTSSCREGRPGAASKPPPPVLDDALDWELVRALASSALERRRAPSAIAMADPQPQPLRRRHPLQPHRRAHGADGLPEDSIVVDFEGSAGQSFGGWLAPGVTFTLRGDANDYAGKGLSGGVFAIRPREGMGEHFRAEENVIVGNTVLYGATSGRAFFRGLAGERFARAQLGRLGRRRGRRRPRLRVHDRRARRRARSDRAQLRRRA